MLRHYELSELPIIRRDRRVFEVSSFDRKEENGDFGQFLYEDKDGSKVLFDEVGKGCIKSIWAAVTTDEATLRFYFDGEERPRYVTGLTGFFTGKVKEFASPANTFLERGHFEGVDCRCGNCFVPIPFEKGLKITAEGKTDFYYHIIYERYCDDFDLSIGSKDTFDRAFNGKYPDKKTTTFETSLKTDKKYSTVFETDSSGVITEFTIEADVNADLSGICLDIFTEGDSIAKVACPILDFFAIPLGPTEVETVAIKTEKKDGRLIMTFRLPIPYWHGIEICFVDLERTGCDLKLKLHIDENGYSEDTAGSLYGDYRRGDTELYGDWLIGDFYGCGNVVGIVQTCFGDQYCEGNEHFYVNGAMTPCFNGTGTEDLYLGCYWPNLKYDSPVAGCTVDVYELGGNDIKGAFENPAAYYRFFHDAPITFENGVRLEIQHGAVGQTYSRYSSLCFSYRRPYPLMTETDVIDLSSKGSMMLHSYGADNFETYHLTGKSEGKRTAPKFSRTGHRYSRGKVTFRVAINAENEGVVLRRIFDKSLSPQSARVLVNGIYAGIWRDPGCNVFAPFGDSDFYIPGSLAKGDILNVTLETDEVFTAFEYRVFSRVKNYR